MIWNVFRCASISCADHRDWLTHSLTKTGHESFFMFDSFLTIHLVSNPTIRPTNQKSCKVKIIQGAKLCKVQNYIREGDKKNYLFSSLLLPFWWHFLIIIISLILVIYLWTISLNHQNFHLSLWIILFQFWWHFLTQKMTQILAICLDYYCESFEISPIFGDWFFPILVTLFDH